MTVKGPGQAPDGHHVWSETLSGHESPLEGNLRRRGRQAGWEGCLVPTEMFSFQTVTRFHSNKFKSKVLVAQKCLTLRNPMDYSPLGSSVHGILQARILQGLPFPSPGIFPTQGRNLGLLHCSQILHRWNHQGGPQ